MTVWGSNGDHRWVLGRFEIDSSGFKHRGTSSRQKGMMQSVNTLFKALVFDYDRLYSVILRSRADSLRSHVILHE